MNCLFVSLLVAAAAPAPVVREPGVLPRADAPLRDGQSVLALCGARLVRTQVRVRRARHPVFAEEPSVRLSVGCRDARAIVANLPGRDPPRAQVSPAVPTTDAPARIRLGSSEALLRPVSAAPGGFHLLWSAGGRSTEIFENRRETEARVEVLWAGDLDGDGTADVLAAMRDRTCPRQIHLFLSRGTGAPRHAAGHASLCD